MPPRHCLGCGVLTTATRCATCRANRRREAYGGDYPKRRAEQIERSPVCERCGERGTPANPLSADHVVPVARGGARGKLRTLCRRCNSARGARAL